MPSSCLRREAMRRTPTLGLALALLPLVAAAPPDGAPSNRLAREASPYLRLHQHNPVQWYPWGPEALAAAKEKNLPIFLSIGYSSCHWCHVMNRESFADPKIAHYLNEHFICIKVDREERPDVDHVYMSAIQAITGDGGWPLSAFLLPDGRPFLGGTYFPPQDKVDEAGKLVMPGFSRVLNTVVTLLETRRPDVEKQAASLTDFLRREATAPRIGGEIPTPAMTVAAADKIAGQWDLEWGGLAVPPDFAPKFPQPALGIYLLEVASAPAPAAGRAELIEAAVLQADRMLAGGLYDQIGGGFHRYSVDRRWIVPHFEKMLYDQAQLISLYSRIHQAKPSPEYERVIRETIAFVQRELMNSDALFGSALDADSEGQEGKFYVWSRSELEAAAGANAAWVLEFLGADGPPNFEGQFLPTRAHPQADPGSKWNEVRSILLETRNQRPRPLKDPKAIVSWNALMVVALADSAQALADEEIRRLALDAADRMEKLFRAPGGGLVRHRIEGKALGTGFADDHAGMVLAALAAHRLDPTPERLASARRWADLLIERFWDPAGKGFFFAADGQSLVVPIKESYDGAFPSANGLGALALVELAAATGEDRYRQLAGAALATFQPAMVENPAGTSVLWLAARRLLAQKPGP